jgi:hypothetical protein
VRFAFGIVLAAMTLPLHAAAPKIDGLFPAGAQSGTECEVMVLGAFEPWPLTALCDETRITFSPDEKEKGKYRVAVGAEVEPGPYLVRFFNAEGATEPRIFVVGSAPERTPSGTDAMPIDVADLPLTLNGKLESSGEVDRFIITLEAGQTLVAEVAAYALDSPLDPLLHLRGPRGEPIAFNHDATRAGLDPRLVFTAPAAGCYELYLSAFAYPPQANIQFAGGATSIYRLNLGHEVPVLELPPPLEADGEEPQTLTLPATIHGRIDPPGDADRFCFEAKKGEIFHLEVLADAIGSWMDPILVLEDSEGNELKRQDDIDSKAELDAKLDWSAPVDGTFTAVIRDLNGDGGREIAYRFHLSKPDPSLAATAGGTAYAIKAGQKLEIAVNVERRHGFTGDLEVGAADLPPGITAPPVAVPEKGETKLVLEAAADAASANVPFTLWVGAKEAAEDLRVPCRFEVKGATTEPGDLLVSSSDRAWLTVLGKN